MCYLVRQLPIHFFVNLYFPDLSIRMVRSVRKPSRPSMGGSIDNPRLVIRMKSSTTKKVKLNTNLIAEEVVKTTRKKTKANDAQVKSDISQC